MNEAFDFLIRERGKRREVIDAILNGINVDRAAREAKVAIADVTDWVCNETEFRECYERLRLRHNAKLKDFEPEPPTLNRLVRELSSRHLTSPRWFSVR